MYSFIIDISNLLYLFCYCYLFIYLISPNYMQPSSFVLLLPFGRVLLWPNYYFCELMHFTKLEN